MILKEILFSAIIILLIGTAGWAKQMEIKFDNGSADRTTVIGLYRDGGLSYHQRADISLNQADSISDAKLMLHVHIGSKIEPAPGEDELKIGIRVNEGRWHWTPIDQYMDDKNHWLEFDIPADELRTGLNKFETDSTVGSWGNMTPQSVDMLGDAVTPLVARSSHTHDFRSYMMLPDRNWGMRLRYQAHNKAETTDAASIRISPEKINAKVGEPVQITAQAFDYSGREISIDEYEWSATHGSIDRYGLYVPTYNGTAAITVKANGRKAMANVTAELKTPAGVAGPTDARRQKPRVPEGSIDLTGKWSFRLDPLNVGEKDRWYDDKTFDDWGGIHVPGSWQAQGWGLDYHGIGWYSRSINLPDDWNEKNIWLNFDGAATLAKVWVNGQYAGEHIGDWAPFMLNITDFVKPGAENRIEVRVEEIPNHFSVGFPMVVSMHFGGLWQTVSISATGDAHIDDVFVLPNLAGKQVRVETSLSKGNITDGQVECTILDPDGMKVGEASVSGGENLSITMPIPDPQPWSPDSPKLYTALVKVYTGRKLSDSQTVRFGMRDMARDGSKILLNGKPLSVRGVLHWGYYPFLLNIDPSEEVIRKELSDIKAAGFNLVKICLFMMPKRYYEIADEMGMMIWQEYPIWQTFPNKDDKEPHYELDREFAEWVRFDRNHPSIILRDLMCEGWNVNNDIAGRLFDLTKSLTGHSALIEDNSAAMNQVYTDWYDWHMYMELDFFYGHLPAFTKDLREKPDIKPYLTGEDLDCDTWRDTASIIKKWVKKGERPWWLNTNGFRLQESVEKEMVRKHGKGFVKELVNRQNRRAIAVRKAYFEDFRRYPELTGYVMTAIRDNPLTNPGFFDDLDQPKWSPDEWRTFNDDCILTLYSPRRSFAFRADEMIDLTIGISNYDKPLADVPLKWKLNTGQETIAQGEIRVSADQGEVKELIKPKIDGSVFKDRKLPLACELVVELGENGSVTRNSWMVRMYPYGTDRTDRTDGIVYVYSSSDVDALAADINCANTVNITHPDAPVNSAEMVLVTDSLDKTVSKALEDGARVIYLAPQDDNRLPRKDTPFWREMMIWLPIGHPALGDFPHDGIADTQFIDMTQGRPFDTSAFKPEIDPIIWGMNARFMQYIQVDYIFQANVGKGKLIASCLNLRGENNVAGQYLLECLVKYASGGEFKPAASAGKLVEMIKAE
ncbi:MAG: glycoside hydrolase family 2 protein [Armatimonadota bacterium]